MSHFPPDVTAVCNGLTRLCQTARLTQGARFALLAARDRDHALTVIEEVAGASDVPTHRVTPSGVWRYDHGTASWILVRRGDLTPAHMLDQARTSSGLVVFEQLLPQLQDTSPHVQARVQLGELLAQDQVGRHGLVMVCLEPPETQSHLPAILAEQVDRFSLGYPRIAELETMTRAELARIGQLAGQPLPIETIMTHATALAECQIGLTRKAARDSLSDAVIGNLADLSAATDLLQKRKTERLSRELSMEVLDAGESAETPLGMENVLEFLEIQKPSMRLWGPGRAKGLLLVGPPGVGKTMLARAAGRLTGLPVVVLRVGALMTSLLGGTERLFNQAFATLEAMAPCIVFIDEIEKAFSENSERDGGTMMRVTGALLSWLNDNMNPNYIIATCNNLDKMGAVGKTMTRSGRFDATFFLDVPSQVARRAIWAQCMGPELSNDGNAVDHLAGITAMFSGADIHSVAKLARARAVHVGETLTLMRLEDEIARKRPRISSLYTEFEDLRRWAASNAEPAATTV